jgi:tripartite-type tricarboxylate transporter receptor subunit TctC
VQLLFDSIVSGLPHVRDGKLKALAITSARRSPPGDQHGHVV